MEADDHNLSREHEETLARHFKLAEVVEGKRALDWADIETFIHDSHCLTPEGKRVAFWSIGILGGKLSCV